MQKVYTKIESIVGNVVTVRATGVRNGDLALVGDSYANVIKLDKDLVTLQVFSGTQGVSTTDPVRFLGRPMMVSFSDHLLGRIFDGAGVPRDNGPALTENMIPIGGLLMVVGCFLDAKMDWMKIEMTPHLGCKQLDAHRYPHDRRVQHPGGKPEAAHLLRVRRAV